MNKNIVVLSDGTGNGAAKAQKTNVWRLYRALDLHSDRQIAFYDDGVGSGNGRLSKILGGAFGYGLKRNVLEMYKFLCRNYRPADGEGIPDRIYLFGFSRGAFTVRVLASFIELAGLIDARNLDRDSDLDGLAEMNYSLYRRRYDGGFIYRKIVCPFLFRNQSFRTDYKPRIEFLGVWDTVDAYALPMDELARIWHHLVYPIRFTNFDLSGGVTRARHAISVDDERYTFHPVLWNEPPWNEPPPGNADLQQVWFAGVHANVGGGYPDDSLALVSLDWMMTECESEDPGRGLVFIPELRRQYHHQSDWNGPIYNSRAGIGVFYRYNPRNIEHLCDPPDIDLHIPRTTIHRSVFERIANAAYPYAPSGLPEEYHLTGAGRQNEYETPDTARERKTEMEAARDMIFLRRGLYMLLLAVSILLIASRYFLEWDADVECAGAACAVAPLLDWVPDIASPWVRALLQNGGWLVAFIAAFVAMGVLARRLRRATRRRATRAWSALNGMQPGSDYWPGVISRLHRLWERQIGYRVRGVVAALLAVALFYLIVWVIDASVFHVRDSLGGICRSAESTAETPGPDAPREINLSVDTACLTAPLVLEKGVTYRFDPASTRICDGNQCTTTVDGLVSTTLVQKLFAPFKRHRDQPYMQLMGRIGHSGNETFPIHAAGIEYAPGLSGRLYLYVNDTVSGLLPKWDYFYDWEFGANTGEVDVRVQSVAKSVVNAKD